MNYVKYNRAFVMMEEQNDQFAERESLPIKGYLKVETGNNKGALRCIVQNLRYFEKGDYIYKLILFGKKGERTIHAIMGNLLVNRQGNGETYFRFLPLDVDGKGNAYHHFTTAIIAAASTQNEREPLHPVLKGVTAREGDPFQSELAQVEEEKEKGQSPGIDDMIDKIGKIVEEIEEGVLGTLPEGEEQEQETVQTDQEMAAHQPDQEQAASQPDQEQAARQPDKKEEEACREERMKPTKTYNSFYNEYLLNACVHTCRIAEFYEDVNPFEKDRTGARWKKIVNIANLPLVSPGAHYFATQYRHYIFGAKPDDKGTAVRFYFGIPGRFLDEEQPDGGKSGFTYWQPIRGVGPVLDAGENQRRRNRNAYGYWIVAVDARTGNIEEV